MREITIANESERYAAVVILAKESKETMDDTLIKAIPDPETNCIVATSGDPEHGRAWWTLAGPFAALRHPPYSPPRI